VSRRIGDSRANQLIKDQLVNLNEAHCKPASRVHSVKNYHPGLRPAPCTSFGPRCRQSWSMRSSRAKWMVVRDI
jgi:hypothetical protein